MTKRVRLTESELRDMIIESVKSTINEMDWKTAANAEKKARERGDMSYWREQGETDQKKIFNKAVDYRSKAKNFGGYAKKRFNDEYGYRRGVPYDDDYMEVAMGGDFDASEEFGPHVVGYRDKGYGNPKKYEYGRDRDTYKDVSPEEFFQNNLDAANSYRSASDELNKYKKGKYSYKNGKYEENESFKRMIDRAVNESIKRNLMR